MPDTASLMHDRAAGPDLGIANNGPDDMIKARIHAQYPDSANLLDYEKARASFSWSDLENRFYPEGPETCNIIAMSVDRWAESPETRNHPALVFQSGNKQTSWSYAQLRDISSQWAAMLLKYGFTRGDRLMVFMPASPETWFALAACARIGVVFCPVFASSTMHEIEGRLAGIDPKGVLTTPDLVEKLSVDTAERLTVIFLQKGPAPGLFSNEVIADDIRPQMPVEPICHYFPKQTPLYMIFTSGSTRPPKGIVHCHGDMTGIYTTALWALDLKADTILWADADPAWVTGTVYGAYAPWLHGITSLVAGDGFSPANWYLMLEKHNVTVWYTTPRVLAGLLEAGDDLPRRYDLSNLLHIVTVGAPLVPDIIYWCRRHFTVTPHDTWWMTETGVICIANTPGCDLKPGSMGRPLPGMDAAILDENGTALPPMSIGEIALRPGWPGMMTGIFNEPDRYSSCFSDDGWFMTGDIALCDEEGFFYHHGRNDDLLKAGDNKLIGPFEIEQLLCLHPAVAEAAVIAKGVEPGRAVSCLKAFITPSRGHIPSSRLSYEITAFLKGNLTADLIVEKVEFIESLPRTMSGKLLRRVLRAKELGLPGGEPRNMKD
jgi:acetyl-CoA synthetase